MNFARRGDHLRSWIEDSDAKKKSDVGRVNELKYWNLIDSVVQVSGYEYSGEKGVPLELGRYY